jgi:hypothetical protein
MDYEGFGARTGPKIRMDEQPSPGGSLQLPSMNYCRLPEWCGPCMFSAIHSLSGATGTPPDLILLWIKPCTTHSDSLLEVLLDERLRVLCRYQDLAMGIVNS